MSNITGDVTESDASYAHALEYHSVPQSVDTPLYRYKEKKMFRLKTFNIQARLLTSSKLALALGQAHGFKGKFLNESVELLDQSKFAPTVS